MKCNGPSYSSEVAKVAVRLRSPSLHDEGLSSSSVKFFRRNCFYNINDKEVDD